jgi:hypothetical protein
VIERPCTIFCRFALGREATVALLESQQRRLQKPGTRRQFKLQLLKLNFAYWLNCPSCLFLKGYSPLEGSQRSSHKGIPALP